MEDWNVFRMFLQFLLQKGRQNFKELLTKCISLKKMTLLLNEIKLCKKYVFISIYT